MRVVAAAASTPFLRHGGAFFCVSVLATSIADLPEIVVYLVKETRGSVRIAARVWLTGRAVKCTLGPDPYAMSDEGTAAPSSGSI